VNILETVRQDLLSINRDLQFSFQEDIKPIYDDFIDLLLRSQPKDALPKVTEVIGKLQVAELQNFLQCSSLSFRPLSEVNDPPDAAFYTIVLEGQKKIEVIVSVYNKQSKLPQYYDYSVDLNELQKTVELLESTSYRKPSNKSDKDFLSSSQKLYQLLIAPAKRYLPKTGDLIFVLDSQLQSIPMAILQDEEQHYLVENYSITLSLGGRILEPKKLPSENLRVLIAGASQGPSFKKESEGSPDFLQLHNIQLELEEVEKNTIKSERLFNEDFTKARFQDRVNASKFPVLHIATHGIFNSDPERTVILAYDTRINIRELDSLFRSRSESSSAPLQLLVLSACETAKGDKRAGLGIAGVAVQAGARSTLASLWNVDDTSTALFMGEFYRGLKDGLTKAEALRKAQLAFLKNPNRKEEYKNYARPYYWAPFILVGSWL
jgi:CHAT domain-containing protein